jgi:hypothetical protein
VCEAALSSLHLKKERRINREENEKQSANKKKRRKNSEEGEPWLRKWAR